MNSWSPFTSRNPFLTCDATSFAFARTRTHPKKEGYDKNEIVAIIAISGIVSGSVLVVIKQEKKEKTKEREFNRPEINKPVCQSACVCKHTAMTTV